MRTLYEKIDLHGKQALLFKLIKENGPLEKQQKSHFALFHTNYCQTLHFFIRIPDAFNLKFIDDTRGFFRIARDKGFSKIDTSCKGGDFARQSLKRLTDGFKDTFLMEGLKMYLVDSYSMSKDLNVNFALMEILFPSVKEAKKACRLFKTKEFLFTDALFRAYRPRVHLDRLMIYYKASIADKDLAEYYASIGIKKFLDEE